MSLSNAGGGDDLQADPSPPKRHQVWEFPEIKPLVDEYQLFRGRRACCGIATMADCRRMFRQWQRELLLNNPPGLIFTWRVDFALSIVDERQTNRRADRTCAKRLVSA